MGRIGNWVALATMVSGPAFAQSSDSVTLIAGTLDEVCTVDTVVSRANIGLSAGGSQEVTAVTYTCNTLGGFTRTISSSNGGALVRGSQAIPYTILQSGSNGLGFGASALFAPLISTVPGSAALTQGSTGILQASIPSLPANLLAGEYSDTVTIAITSN